MQAGPTVLNTAGGETLQIPKTTAHSTAALDRAGGGAADVGPDVRADHPVVVQVRRSCCRSRRELLDDTGVDLIGYLAMQAGRAVGNAFGADLVLGNGSAQPAGFMTSAHARRDRHHHRHVRRPAVRQPGGPGVQRHRPVPPVPVVLLDRGGHDDRRVPEDRWTRKNRPIWEPSAVLGSPDLLLGKPIVADPYMPAVGDAAFSVAFGDFAQFFVRLVGGVRFERSDDFAFGPDLVTSVPAQG